jgi:hypothetical protein
VRLRFVLALFLALFFVTSHFSTLISYTSTVSTHGCAPVIPPSVPGSPLPAPAIPGKLLINEVLSLPGSRWNCSEPQNTYSITSDSWIELFNRCKNTILSEHHARWSTYFLSWDVESTVSRFLGRDVRNDVEYDQPA